jgi:anaerobic dimethyl sulfoxide reductase subunit A
MIGSIGVAGGGIPSEMGGTTAPQIPAPFLDFGRQPADYNPPILLNWNKWAAAVLLREKYDKGEITKEDFYRRIGNARDNPMPNLKMRLDLGYISNATNNIMNIKEHIEALKMQEFVVVCASFMHLTAQHADIILPIASAFFEHDHYRDEYQVTGLSNFIIYSPKKVEPLGEAKSRLWICTKIAERLGFVDKYNPAYKGDEKWDEVSEELHKKAYEAFAQNEPTKEKVGAVPSWEEFKKKSVIRFPIKEPYIALRDEVQGGKKFPTASGKIEFYSERAAQINEESHYGNKISPMARWTPGGWGSFTDPNTHKYPLTMLTPHPLFRQHSFNDNNPLLRDEYRHGVWINPADAKARGVKENDSVRVYNDLGEMVIPAYVTSRVTPGVVVIYHGAWYQPDGSGVDRRGAPSALIHSEHIPQTTNRVLRCTDLVQVEKEQEEK